MALLMIQPMNSSLIGSASRISSFHVSKTPGHTTSSSSKFVSNGSRLHCMQVVNPNTNLRFETLSYLPALDAYQISKQVDYIVSKGWVPCLEFDKRGAVFRENSKQCGYYDGRYWTMWKLPMFGCMDASAVLREIEECKNTYPNSYIRVMAFDNKRQAQCVAFVAHRPSCSS